MITSMIKSPKYNMVLSIPQFPGVHGSQIFVQTVEGFVNHSTSSKYQKNVKTNLREGSLLLKSVKQFFPQNTVTLKNSKNARSPSQSRPLNCQLSEPHLSDLRKAAVNVVSSSPLGHISGLSTNIQWIPACVIIAGVSLFLLWSRKELSTKVEVFAGDGDFNNKILDKLPSLKEPYIPFLGMTNCHVETIFAAVFRKRPFVRFKRECLHMADGGTVALDWPITGENESIWKTELPEDAPFLILLPGLTGGSEDTYVRYLLLRARSAGWGTVVFNSRGCADSPVTTPQFYSASFTEDLREVVKIVASKKPKARLYAAGWSLGANILVRYLGQEGKNTALRGAVSLCNPFDLVLADKNFHIGFNNFYDQRLAVALNKIFKKHESLFEEMGGEYNIPLVASAKTVREFDDGLTRVSFGFPSVDDYYYEASSSRSIKFVEVPLLCIQAMDDPIAPADGIPYSDIEDNPYCTLVVTPYGGHLGWVSGTDAPFGAPWTDSTTMEYLVTLEQTKKEQAILEGIHIESNNGAIETNESYFT